MKSFDDWFKELTSDTLWVELLRHYKDDTIKKAGEKVFAELYTLKTLGCRSIEEDRLHVYRVCKKLPEDKVLKPWRQQEAEKKEAEQQNDGWQPVTWEKRAEYLEKLQEIIKGSTMMSGVPRPSYKEQAEEGLDRPKNMPPYPITSKEEYYVKKRHFEYIKANFEARTGQKLPTWINEDDWNIKYDNEHL